MLLIVFSFLKFSKKSKPRTFCYWLYKTLTIFDWLNNYSDFLTIITEQTRKEPFIIDRIVIENHVLRKFFLFVSLKTKKIMIHRLNGLIHSQITGWNLDGQARHKLSIIQQNIVSYTSGLFGKNGHSEEVNKFCFGDTRNQALTKHSRFTSLHAKTLPITLDSMTKYKYKQECKEVRQKARKQMRI